MKIELKTIKIKELVEGFRDDSEEGVTGYGGKLDIRPPYQREFVYNDEQQQAVISTVMKGFPLNTMYWVVRKDGRYEVLDGQQRTLSICNYHEGNFSWNDNMYLKNFHNLTQEQKEKFLDYEMQVYFCEGTEDEKLEWFKTINIAGLKLTEQEIRNAIYAGSWTAVAKKYFSKSGCPAKRISDRYLKATADRQQLLEKAIEWKIQSNDSKAICGYMSQHQNDTDCNDLWLYFKAVIDWVQAHFPKYHKEMQTVPWGEIYAKYHSNTYSVKELEEKVEGLFNDDEIEPSSGIYQYVFTGNVKYLNTRQFNKSQKRRAYNRQGGICPRCVAKNKPTKDKIWDFEEMEGDHITPWHEGGKTTDDNCQMLCRECNREKGGK